MATVNLYFGAGGGAVGTEACTSFATRTKQLTRLKAVMLTTVTANDDVILWGEGVITRYTDSSWAAVSGIMFGFTNTECIGRSLRIASYSTVDSGQTPLTLADFYLYKSGGSAADWTDTATTTTRGTKIWVNTTNLSVGSNGMARVFAADFTADSKFQEKELWEGGNNYNATIGAAVHQNLDVVPGTDAPGICWTQYDSAGALQVTKLYIASQVNPYTAFGVITLASRGTSSIMTIQGIPSVITDPEVTARGGGVRSCYLIDCGTLTAPVRIEHKILNSGPYGNPIVISGTYGNVEIAPWIDPEYKSVVPYYQGGGTDHLTGGNEASMHSASTMLGTGWPEHGGIASVIWKAKASNGRPSRIADQFHCGIASFRGDAGVGFVRVEPGIEFDFSRVKYGRAFGFGKMQMIDVCGAGATSNPTYSQYTGLATSRFRLRGSKFKGRRAFTGLGTKGVPFGTSSTKETTSGGFASYTITGYPTGELMIEDNSFECPDGGINLQTLNSVAFGGKVRIFNNVFIHPSIESTIQNLTSDQSAQGVAIYIATHSAAALPDQIELINNVSIGYGATPGQYYDSGTMGSFDWMALDDLPVSVNVGWIHFDTYEEFMQAKSDGQLPHIKA